MSADDAVVLLAAYLTTAQRHAHHFHQPSSCEGVGALDGLLKMVDRFIDRSVMSVSPQPQAQLRVVHDLKNVSTLTVYRGVQLHQRLDASAAALSSSDARFRLFERELRTLDPEVCAFTIDLSDVRIVGRKPLVHLCRLHPEALFVGNDVCEIGKVSRPPARTIRVNPDLPIRSRKDCVSAQQVKRYCTCMVFLSPSLSLPPSHPI